MTSDSFIKAAIDAGSIIVKPRVGKIYRTITKGGHRRKIYEAKMMLNKDGYHILNITLNKKRKLVFAHRTIWIAQYGVPTKGLVTNHKNCNITDNRACNLEMVTDKENQAHAVRNGRRSKVTEKDVLKMRRLHSRGGINYEELGLMFGLGHAQVRKIVNRESWKHI